MPNDENTQQVQQNQNPVADSNGSATSGASDDFDFDFGSDVGSSVGDAGQGRTGMFLTPDEEAQKEELQNSGQPFSFGKDEVQDPSPVVEENSGGSLFNPNVNSNIDVTNDDMGEVSESVEATDNKFDDKIEDMISFDDDGPASVSESLQNVNVEPVVDDGIPSENNGSNDDLLGDSSLDSQEDTQDHTSLENVNVENEDMDSVVENVENNTDSININDGGDNVQDDDWLQQEDKKVEETFGTEQLNGDSNIEVDESPADVAQNVENLLTSNTVSDNGNNLGVDNVGDNMSLNGLGSVADTQQSSEQYVPNEEDFSAMSNLLNSSSAGQVDINNVNTQPVGNFGFESNVESNVDNLNANVVLDGSQIQGNSDVDMNDSMQNPEYQQSTQPTIDDQQVSTVVDNQQENLSNSFVNVDVNGNIGGADVNGNIGGADVNGNIGGIDVNGNIGSIDVNGNIGGTDVNGNIGSIDVNGNTFSQVNLDSQVTPQIQGNQVYTEIPMNQSVSGTPINQNVDLNSMGTLGGMEVGNVANNNVVNNMENVNDQGGVSLDAILDQEIQNMHVENPGMNQNYVGQVQGQMGQQVVGQNMVVKKRKKQSGFTVLGIFLGVVAVLGVLGYFAFKMFPDKFHNLFKGDVVVEYLAGNENNISTEGVVNDNQGMENPIDEIDNLDNPDEQGVDGENLDNNGLENESGDEIEGNAENGEEELDPNSLAGLLSDDENNMENDNTSETGNVSDDDGLQNQEESNVENVDDNNTNGDNFDPYAEISNVISDVSDSDKLNEYISQGNHYKELGVTNNDKKMERYGEYIVVTATEELGKLENGEEIDNTIFGRLDEILESLK